MREQNLREQELLFLLHQMGCLLRFAQYDSEMLTDEALRLAGLSSIYLNPAAYEQDDWGV